MTNNAPMTREDHWRSSGGYGSRWAMDLFTGSDRR